MIKIWKETLKVSFVRIIFVEYSIRMVPSTRREAQTKREIEIIKVWWLPISTGSWGAIDRFVKTRHYLFELIVCRSNGIRSSRSSEIVRRDQSPHWDPFSASLTGSWSYYIRARERQTASPFSSRHIYIHTSKWNRW